MSSRHPGVIVVGGSPPSDAALHWALGEAAARGLHVQVVTAERVGDPVDQRLAHHLDRVGTAHPGVPRWQRQVRGPAGEALVALAAEADLLVVGSQGPARALPGALGSVAAHCLRHAPCPVVVIPAAMVAAREPTRLLTEGVRR